LPMSVSKMTGTGALLSAETSRKTKTADLMLFGAREE
jgi:hypothetical protein